MNAHALKAAREHDPAKPGKFEGEPPETVYFWLSSLEGGFDEDLGCGTGLCFVTPEEAAEFHISGPYFGLFEDGNGFVWGAEMDEEEAEKERQNHLQCD